MTIREIVEGYSYFTLYFAKKDRKKPKKSKQETYKRKFDEISSEEKVYMKKLEQIKAEKKSSTEGYGKSYELG